MRTVLVGFALAAVVACNPGAGASGPIPEGNWAVTLAFAATTAGDCASLPPTTDIHFAIGLSDGVHTFMVEAGLAGDTIDPGSALACNAATCTLDLSDTGPGHELTNIQIQTITAALTEDTDDDVTGSGQIDFAFTDGSSCTAVFDGTGNVAH